MSNHCLLIAGGEFSSRLPEETADLIIAVDKGYSYAQALHLTPDIVIGDLDSLSDCLPDGLPLSDEPYIGRNQLSPFETETAEETSLRMSDGSELPVVRLYKKKDDPDTLAAVRYALQKGMRTITFCCIMGGRFDHMLANLQTAAFAARYGAKAVLLSDTEEIHVIHNSSVAIEKKEGWSLSAFSLSDTCTGVDISGTYYTACDLTVTNDIPFGLSNEWASDTAIFSVKEGTLAVILSRLPERS